MNQEQVIKGTQRLSGSIAMISVIIGVRGESHPSNYSSLFSVLLNPLSPPLLSLQLSNSGATYEGLAWRTKGMFRLDSKPILRAVKTRCA